MNEAIIITITKTFFTNIYILLVDVKILDRKIRFADIMKIICISAFITIIYTMSEKYINRIIMTIMIYFIQSLLLKLLIKNNESSFFVTNLISNAIIYIIFGLSVLLEGTIILVLKLDNKIFHLLCILIIEAIIICLLLKIKRFRHGFTFLRNNANHEYTDIIMINISATIILGYTLFRSYYDKMTRQVLMSYFLLLGLIMLIMIQKTFTLYYKQKLLARNIEDYKNEIAEKDKQIEKLSNEKYEISKLNHEFYNRQKALEKKVQDFIANVNTETDSELSVIESINNLSKEYSGKLEGIKTLDKLPETGIEEIDDMFKYMQSECKKNNIDFKLQVNRNIHHMVNKLIPQNKLVTLIGDHIRDAIIAIENSTNKFKSIIAIIGANNKYYEFCVYDTGIEFEIDTLLKLGLEPATTHKDTGGSGIGFMTTFETMKETKASLIIEEKHKMMDNDYTKSVTIRFDGKNEYRIKSYRADEIKKKCKDNRIIITGNEEK